MYTCNPSTEKAEAGRWSYDWQGKASLRSQHLGGRAGRQPSLERGPWLHRRSSSGELVSGSGCLSAFTIHISTQSSQGLGGMVAGLGQGLLASPTPGRNISTTLLICCLVVALAAACFMRPMGHETAPLQEREELDKVYISYIIFCF